ncbi:sugar ABC transporter ATP-binding protein [Longispora sp. NPDC051575]|uniref:sugar ABC transporter ATP-binding protein n=1 Tax=Longispora sp. NPDC051575 TaxID=3154943 RepID=UPI00344A6BE2
MTNPSPPVVAAEAVSKRYGVTVALRDVSLRVEPGEIHALVGRNGAGKSTLVSLLTGLQAPDTGTVSFGGTPAPPIGDREGWRSHVACVYQKSTIIGSLSVAENVFLNRQAHTRAGLIGWGSVRRQARELLETWDVRVDVRVPAAELPVEQRQLVEIARALSYGSRFIILDEPTAQLDGQAIAGLFDRMTALKEQGVTFLFISHHLEEVYQVCDTVTVMRDAGHILTAPVADLPKPDLVAAMTGEATGLVAMPGDRPAPATGAVPALRVTDLSVAGVFAGLSLSVAPGEVVGLAGSGGSGKMAAAETVVGLRPATTGTVEVGGRRLRSGSVPDALAAGVGFVPQDRHHEGLVPGLSIAENATMTVPGRLGRWGFLSAARRTALGERAIRELGIKAAGPEQPVQDLSGGNQQKVVMARALANDPTALVLLQPTAGVDVRAKETLLAAATDAAARGAGVLIVSDDLDDLRPADRVLVLYKGTVVDEMPRGWHDHALIAAMEGVSS